MRRTLDASGTLTSQQRYLPFGAVRDNIPAPNGLPTTDLGYTGQRDLGMGLMDYHARFYSPSLGRFTQPDSIIPNAGNPQSWNRYSYVYNNPIRFTDPTGHMCREDGRGCDGSGDTKIGNKIIRNRYGSSNKDKILKKNNDLKKSVDNDLEALSLLSDYGASLTPDCTSCFINNMGAVLTGYDEGNYEWNFLFGEPSHYYIEAEHFEQSGYAEIFQDPPDAVKNGGGNQAYHFWFYVQVGYESGEVWGNSGVILHETVLGNNHGKSAQDAYLGYEGTKLGALLKSGEVNPSEVGDYIRNALSPGSMVSQQYQDWYDGFWESVRVP